MNFWSWKMSRRCTGNKQDKVEGQTGVKPINNVRGQGCRFTERCT